MSIEFDNSLKASELRKASKSCRQGVNHKDSVMKYDDNCLLSNDRLGREVRDDTYSISKYVHFTITEPKVREIDATKYRDRVWQRSMTNNGVREMLTKNFIYDNGACQKNKGTDFAICRVIYFLQDYYRRNGSNEGYGAHLDIKGFFPNTPHEVAKARVRERVYVPEFSYHICMVVDSCKDKRPQEEIDEDPFGERGSLLGSELMQMVQLAIPDHVDHHIKEDMGIKYYCRFNDDFLFFHRDKEAVKEVIEYIQTEMAKLGLSVVNKGGIFKLNESFRFLRKRFILTDTGKVIIRIDQKSLGEERRRLKRMKRLVDEGKRTMDAVRRHYQSWSSSALRADSEGAIRKMDEFYFNIFGEKPEGRKRHAYPRSKRAVKKRKAKKRRT